MKLAVAPVRQETQHLNVFGSESSNRRRCNMVRLKLQQREEIEVMALSFPSICSRLPQAVKLPQCSQLQELDLANYLTPDKSSNYVSVKLFSHVNFMDSAMPLRGPMQQWYT